MGKRRHLLFDWFLASTMGLFFSRIAGELWGLSHMVPLTGTQIGILTVLITIVCLIILRHYRFQSFWPAVFLLFYVFYPEVSLPMAGYVLGVTVTAVFIYHLRASNTSFHLAPIITGSLLALCFFLLYLYTLSPDVLPADNGEFQWVAAQLGVAHPPGFPLYTMLGYAAAHLPIGPSPAYRVNLLSAATSAMTLFVLFQIVYRLTKRQLAAITAVTALGTATTFWAQATTANIRSLTGLFAALFFLFLLQFHYAKAVAASGRYLSWAAAALGFGITHHPSLIFIGTVGIIFVFWQHPEIWKQPRRWKRPFLYGILGFLPWLYLPLRAGSGAPGAVPQLATVKGFLDHVLARGFSGDFFYFIAPDILWERFRVMGNVLTFQFYPLLLWGMGLGLLLLVRKERQLAFLLGGSFILHTFITATYRAPQTVEYMLPAYVPAVILIGSAAGYALNRLQNVKPVEIKQHLAAAIAVTGTAVLFITTIAQGIAHYPSFAQLHRSVDTRHYTETVLTQAPTNALILADWHWYTPLRYLQAIEQQRPDVTIKFVPPGEGRYEDTWATRIAEELENGRIVIATHFEERAYAQLPPAAPIGEAYLFRQVPLQALPAGFTAAHFNLADVQVLGFQLNRDAVPIGQETMLTLAWQTADDDSVPLYVHLIGFDGRLYAQDDLTVRPQAAGITLTQFRLTPRPGAAPGDFAVWLGQGERREQLTTLTVTAMSNPPATQQPVYRTIVGERPFRRLVGYDWDHTLPGRTRLYLHWQTEHGYQTEIVDDTPLDALPPYHFLGPWGIAKPLWTALPSKSAQHYVPFGQGIIWVGGVPLDEHQLNPGDALVLRPRFLSSQSVLRDLAASVRLVGFQPDSELWAWSDQDDSIPAMGAIPTLKWIG
ncbi:MAG: DUF2723 domain-containing protein, partial [Anaerolineales bacterium]|nr:DUF2723 domain-containing protein [Anaerolineales bacterium]